MRISDLCSDVCSADQLDYVSGGRAAWQAVLESFWRDFKPRTSEVMDFKPSEVTAELDQFLENYLFPANADGSDPRLCPNCGEGRLALRGGRYGAFVARSEEHTSELQSLLRISYAVFCLKTK